MFYYQVTKHITVWEYLLNSTFFASINLWHDITTGLANAGCSTDNVRSVYFIESMNCCEDASNTNTDLFVVDDKLLNGTKTELSRPEALLLVPVEMQSSFASIISVPRSLDGAAGVLDTRPTPDGFIKPLVAQISEAFAPLSSRLSSST